MSFVSFLAAAQPAADTTRTAVIEQKLEAIAQMPVDQMVTFLIRGLLTIGSRLLIAVLIFFVGRWIIRAVRRTMKNVMTRREVDPSLRSFLMSLVSITLMLFLIVVIIGILGINTTSFVALFASAGLAVGMALSGTLQNFAGGVIILLFKPFRVGDYIEAQGQAGTVKEIQLFNTVLNTPDNKTIMVPNGDLSTGIVNNYSKETRRRVDWTFGIGYGDDYDKAKATILELLRSDPRVHADPAPFVALTSLGDSSVNIVVRVWTDSADYWNVFFDMNERVYKRFAEVGLNIPYPQMDVHLYRTSEKP